MQKKYVQAERTKVEVASDSPAPRLGRFEAVAPSLPLPPPPRAFCHIFLLFCMHVFSGGASSFSVSANVFTYVHAQADEIKDRSRVTILRGVSRMT